MQDTAPPQATVQVLVVQSYVLLFPGQRRIDDYLPRPGAVTFRVTDVLLEYGVQSSTRKVNRHRFTGDGEPAPEQLVVPASHEYIILGR